jgi:hypothetical protein
VGVQLADTHQDPNLVDELPPVFQKLLRAEQLLLNCATVEGTFFVECFHGDGAVALACVIKGIPCICPFDTQYGDEFDLLKNGEVLNELVRTERVGSSHIGTPCQSVTIARSPQLSDADHIEGLPGLLPHQLELVRLGTALIRWSVQFCLLLHQHGGFFSLENPVGSWAWWFPCMIALYLMTGVICTLFKQQQFGTPYEKQTLFIHDVPTYHRMKEEVSLPRPTLKLRGRLKFDGIECFKTKLSQAYPVDMGLRMADLLVEALALKARARDAGIPAA